MEVWKRPNGYEDPVELVHEDANCFHVKVVVAAEVDKLEDLLRAVARQRLLEVVLQLLEVEIIAQLGEHQLYEPLLDPREVLLLVVEDVEPLRRLRPQGMVRSRQHHLVEVGEAEEAISAATVEPDEE